MGNLPDWSVEMVALRSLNSIILVSTLWILFWRCLALSVGDSGGSFGLVAPLGSLVDLMPCQIMWRSPMVVASDAGRCFCTSVAVSPGQVP